MLLADQMRARLAKAVKEAGGQKAWADLNGVSAQYVCDCLKGRRDIGESISKPLGFEPITVYISTKLSDRVLRQSA